MNWIDERFHYGTQEHTFYLEHGYFIFEHFLTPAGLEYCRQEIDAMLAKLEEGRKPEEILSAHQQERWLFEFAIQPQLLDMIEQQVGPNIVLWSSQMLCKPPYTGEHVPWHQDAPYWNVSGPLPGAIWIALDDVSYENGSMGILPRWHRKGTFQRRNANGGSTIFTDEIEPSELPPNINDLALEYKFKAGQMGTHDTMLPHCSMPNKSDRWRRVMGFRYMTPEGAMGRELYPNYRTGQTFEREYYLVRGTAGGGRTFKREPDFGG